MLIDHRERLASIRRFDQLVAYLRDELGWPIDSDDFEELTFEYPPEELGIDAKNAANIQEIKRLRPLVSGQPWGIFFVKFEPKRLPVMALRRILGQVALRKRTADRPERRTWAADDLLFVSNYGEREERRIAFAHFSKPRDGHELPTLKVLGWDNLDTPLHLDAVARDLTDHLAWPDNDDDLHAWRERWRSAFTLRHREVIATSKELSERLAELARATRDRIRTALAIETESGPLTKLMNAFQTALVHDLDEADFADAYAQTIAYGLLSARITDPARRTADSFAAHMRTNPFLKELMETFLRVGGRRGKPGGPSIDFDELGVSDVVQLLDEANMEAVVRDFGDRNPQEDPVIHFYEHFLAAYDKKQKLSRGVFYTPRPVVSYIVRSVDGLLRNEFGLTDGLADTSTWAEMAQRQRSLMIPDGIPSDKAFVQILDPAVGTGTFIVEVIDLIHKTMVERWKDQGHGAIKLQELWNEYVPMHLLPRLHGYELLMAPYAIAHLKIGLKLYETGYHFDGDERARVYLTNALELPSDVQLTLDFLQALAHEAAAVTEIKQKQRFTVVIGNPPYRGISTNKGPWIDNLLKGRLPDGTATESYYHVNGEPLGERKVWLQDDYVKFIRLSQWLLERTGVGILGYITNHGYLDNPTFRGMRWSLMQSFHRIRVLDLHGNLKKKEVPPEGGLDQNVFDIQQGVAIGLFTKFFRSGKQIRHTNLWGTRGQKYEWLLRHCSDQTDWRESQPTPPFYLYEPRDDLGSEYASGWKITDVFPTHGVGAVMARDSMTVDFDANALWDRVKHFAFLDPEKARNIYRLGNDARDWKVMTAQADLKASGPNKKKICTILYRPFDIRFTYYTGNSRGFYASPCRKVMLNMVDGENLGLALSRRVETGAFTHVFCTREVIGHHSVSLKEVNYLFPLWLVTSNHAPESLLEERRPNLDPDFLRAFADSLSSTKDKLEVVQWLSREPENVLAYIYAVFHSPRFRISGENHLRLDFPRVPLPGNARLFQELSEIGNELLALHLLDSPKLNQFVTTQAGPKNPVVDRVGWLDGTVWLDAAKTRAREGHRAAKPGTIGFRGVPEEVWDFRIGGYHICHKWLNDRKGRALSDEDVVHYQKIVVALNETIRNMAEIDNVIETHGGWPNAFRAGVDRGSMLEAKIVGFRPRTVKPATEDRYVACAPLVPLKAAAGAFSDPQYVEDDDFEWVAVESRHRLRKGMFVAQVVGKSMEPAIQDGAWCLFRGPVEGTRQGKIVLVQLRDTTDPETGQRYTIKRYKSEKVQEGDSWHHDKITLGPVNPDFESIILTGADEDELQVIAELVEVLGG